MEEILTTREMAARLGVTSATVAQWGYLYGCPRLKKYFKGGTGRGGPRGGTGWDPGQVIDWLERTARMNENGKLVNAKTGELIAKRVDPPPAPPGHNELGDWHGGLATPGVIMVALAHCLAAFAFACEHGGIPHSLQELLEAADLEKMNEDALDIIEEMALRHPKTEAQWMLIKPALAVLIGRAKAGAPGDNGLPIKITIQAGPNMADKIDLKVIGYNAPDPAKGE